MQKWTKITPLPAQRERLFIGLKSASCVPTSGLPNRPPPCFPGHWWRRGRTRPPHVPRLCRPSASRSAFCYVRTVVWGCRLSPGLTDLSLQVWAVNSAGKAPSSWSRCRTGPAPPEGLGAPRFHAVSSRHAVVNISAPARPNGMVSVYRLFCETGSGARTVVSSRAPGPRAGSPHPHPDPSS